MILEPKLYDLLTRLVTAYEKDVETRAQELKLRQDKEWFWPVKDRQLKELGRWMGRLAGWTDYFMWWVEHRLDSFGQGLNQGYQEASKRNDRSD